MEEFLVLRMQKLYKDPDVFLYNEDFYAYISDLEKRHALKELPRNLYVFYVLNTLRAEVNNGGFAQFLANSSRLVFRELLPCAEFLDVPEFTALVREFTAAVDSWLETHSTGLECVEFDDEFDSKLEQFDERFYVLDDKGLWKKILKYYKTNFIVNFIESFHDRSFDSGK